MLRKPVGRAAAPESPVAVEELSESEPEPEPEPEPEESPVELASSDEVLVVRVALETMVELRMPVMLPAAVTLGPSRVPVPTRGGAVVTGPGPVVMLPREEVRADAAEVREDRPAASVGTR